jgi:hypothetical protein
MLSATVALLCWMVILAPSAPLLVMLPDATARLPPVAIRSAEFVLLLLKSTELTDTVELIVRPPLELGLAMITSSSEVGMPSLQPVALFQFWPTVPFHVLVAAAAGRASIGKAQLASARAVIPEVGKKRVFMGWILWGLRGLGSWLSNRPGWGDRQFNNRQQSVCWWRGLDEAAGGWAGGTEDGRGWLV